MHFLSTYNRNQMKDVFLGKGTWAVLCSGEGAGYDAVFKRFGTASKAMKGTTKFGVVDCSGSLPSGKSILQKFKLSVRALNFSVMIACFSRRCICCQQFWDHAAQFCTRC